MIFSQPVFAQSPENSLPLANEYYANGEYEKAIDLYEKIMKNKNYVLVVHEDYFDALQKLEKYDAAEKYIKKLIKEKPQLYYLQIDYVLLLKRLKKNADADKILNEMVGKVKSNVNEVRYVLNDLLTNGLYELAEKMLLEAQNETKYNFALDLANVYSFQGKTEKMLDAYMDYVDADENNLDLVLNTLPYKLTTNEDYERLEPVVFKRVQKSPEKIAYAEILVWIYLQKQEFYNAFLQAKAIDKRKNLEGSKIFEIE